MAPGSVREPAVAGMFYYLDPKHLETQVDGLFSGVRETQQFGIVVSPHAGFQYSGKTAAHAIGSLKKMKTFVILGPNHTGIGYPFSIMTKGMWQTPLGLCMIDDELAGKLEHLHFITKDSGAHSQEHSIEVQLPLLQRRFGRDFRFVPISIMNTSYAGELLDHCVTLGEELARLMKDGKVGIIASSDFSHYLPYTTAKAKDKAAIGEVLKLDPEGFFETLRDQDASVCGFGPIAVAMAAAKKLGLKPKPIHESSSGEETKDYDSVVTYHAIGFG